VNFLFRKQRLTADQIQFSASEEIINEVKSASILDKFSDQNILESSEMLELKGGAKQNFAPIFHFQQGCGGLSPQ
jgi:hypothetical protein